MSRRFSTRLAMNIFATMAFSGLAMAEEPQDVLKSKGLIQSGIYFVTPSESQVIAEVKRLEPAMAEAKLSADDYLGAKANQEDYLRAIETKNLAEHEKKNVEDELESIRGNNQIQFQLRRNELQKKLKEARARMHDAETVIKTLQPRQLPVRRYDMLYERARSLNVRYYEQAEDVRAAYAKARAEYNALAKDPEVVAAVAAVGRRTQIPAKLGPSKTLEETLNIVRTFERQYLRMERMARKPTPAPAVATAPTEPKKEAAPAVAAAPAEPKKEAAPAAQAPINISPSDQIADALDTLKSFNFPKNAEKAALKRGAVVRLENMKKGRIIASELREAIADLEKLKNTAPAMPKLAPKIERAIRNIQSVLDHQK